MARTALKKSATQKVAAKVSTRRATAKSAAARKEPSKARVKATRAAVKPAAQQVPQEARRATRAPVVAKADLRAAIEKLEASVAALRTKNRIATRELKAANARIAELETQLAAAEKATAKQASSKPRGKAPVKRVVQKKAPAIVQPAEPPQVEDPVPAEIPQEENGVIVSE